MYVKSKRNVFLYGSLASLVLAGCTASQETAGTASSGPVFESAAAQEETSSAGKEGSHSAFISSLAADSREANRRPYYQDGTYYTNHEEVTLLSHELVTDQEGSPVLLLWLRYLNTGEETSIPFRIKGSFHFYQNGQELTGPQPALPAALSEQDPKYAEGYRNSVEEILPGQETEIYLPIPLIDNSDVTLTMDEKVMKDDPSDDIVLRIEE